MITDTQALACTPPSGWLRRYVEHAMKQTTAPAAYHVACGLALLASTVPVDMKHRYAGVLHGNFYTLLIGRSGDDQKSSALYQARRLLRAVNDKLEGRPPGSWEGLIDSLADNNRQTLFYSEFGDFLSKANNPGYFAPMKTTLTDLWDCLDERTEVLTPDGWRGIEHVGRFGHVLAWSPEDQRLRWEAVADQGARDLGPGERMVYLDNGTVDLRVTEGHRVYLLPESRQAQAYQGHLAGTLPERRGRVTLPLVGAPVLPGTEPSLPAPAELSAAAWAHTALHLSGPATGRISERRARALGRLIGWALLRGSCAPGAPHLLRLGDLRGAKVDIVRQLCRDLRLGVTPETEDRASAAVFVRLDVGDLPGLFGRALDPAHRLAVLGRLPGAVFALVAEGLLEAGRVGGRYVPMAPELAASLAAAGAVHGLHSTALARPQPNVVWFHFTGRKTCAVDCVRDGRGAFTAEEPAAGERVWCVTVPSGAILVRRSGRVYAVGNCTPQARAKAKGKGPDTSVSVPDPRLSLIGGCSLSYLMDHTVRSDWEGGFLGRFFFVFARRERIDPDPVGDDTAVAQLVRELSARASLVSAPACMGLDEQAKAYWADWFYRLEATRFPEAIAGAKTRIPTMARKLAMLLAWDFGTALQGTPWYIGLPEIAWALQLVNLHLQSIISLAEHVIEHPDARLRRDVLYTVPIGDYRTFGQILEQIKLPYRRVKEILDGLVLEGRMTMHTLPGGDGLANGGLAYMRLR